MPVAAAKTLTWPTVFDGTTEALPSTAPASRAASALAGVLLQQSQLRAITGAGEDLSAIPGADGKYPVDVGAFARSALPECAWVLVETHTLGPEVEDVRETTSWNPPRGAPTSQSAAAHRDVATTTDVFDAPAGNVRACGSSVAVTFCPD